MDRAEEYDIHSIVITYIAIAIAILSIFLAITQRYVASLISLASAIVILSFVSDRRCRG
jgi:uncharacterized membrane protein (UPF0182 family)